MTRTPPEQTATGLQAASAAQPLLPSITSVVCLLPASRRRHVRFEVRRLETHSPVFGRVIEASSGGLRFESTQPVLAGGHYTFRTARGSRFLHLPGRVAWSRLDRVETTPQGSRAIFQAGVELEGLARRAWLATLAASAGAANDL